MSELRPWVWCLPFLGHSVYILHFWTCRS